MTDDLDAETLARGLAMGEYRVLRRVEVEEIECPPEVEADTLVAAVVDVETSGLDPAEDAITELALRRIRFDGEGRVVKVDRLYSWLEDPGRPIPDDVVRLTGISNEMLADKRINEAQATKLLSSADVIISHNAAFDRPFIDKRLPGVRGRPWACSCDGVDWKTLGFNGRALGWLLAQRGWFHEAHRAAADVDGLVTLLREEICPGFPILQALIDRARQPSFVIRAVGAHFDVRTA